MLLAGTAAVSILLGFADNAEARRCAHGQIKRVSLGICVGRTSRAARGFVHPGRRHSHRQRRFVRRHHHHSAPVALEPEELPDEVQVKPPPPQAKIQERVERSGKEGKLPVLEEAPTLDIPMGITGSLLMRPPARRPFDWLSTEHQHP